MSSEVRWTELKTVEDITDEIREIVQGVVEGWFSSGRINQEDFADRVEGHTLNDGSKLLLPQTFAHPVFKELKKIAKEAQAE